MRKLSLLAALLLTGCSICGTPAPSVAPVAPTAQAPRVYVLEGQARYYGEAFAGAAVAVTPAGASTPVATGTTNADGKFRFALPDSVKPGTMLKVTASRDGHVVANFAVSPGVRQVLQTEEVVELVLLDENGTLAYLILSPRVEAAAQVSTESDGTINVGVTREALNAFKAAVEAIRAQAPSRTQFEQATQGANEQLSLTESLVAAIKQVVPAGLVPALEQQAESLAVLIREQVKQGKPKPDPDKTAALSISKDKDVPAVFQENTEKPTTDPGPGPGPEPTKPLADATGALDVTDGRLLDPAATATISLEDPQP